MSKLHWRIELENGAVFSGAAEPEGEVHVVCPLPDSPIRSVTGRMALDWRQGDRLFVNGFQSWTYSPEFTETDRLRGLKHLPSAGVKHFGLDRYGDNYFVKYQNSGTFVTPFTGTFKGRGYQTLLQEEVCRSPSAASVITPNQRLPTRMQLAPASRKSTPLPSDNQSEVSQASFTRL